jgi:hypothetical protein
MHYLQDAVDLLDLGDRAAHLAAGVQRDAVLRLRHGAVGQPHLRKLMYEASKIDIEQSQCHPDSKTPTESAGGMHML